MQVMAKVTHFFIQCFYYFNENIHKAANLHWISANQYSISLTESITDCDMPY